MKPSALRPAGTAEIRGGAYADERDVAQRHAVTLGSFVRPSDSLAAVDHLRSFCPSVHMVAIARSRPRDAYHLARSLIADKSFVIGRDWVPTMVQKLVELAASKTIFDAMHAGKLWMAPVRSVGKRAKSPPARPSYRP